MASVLIVDDDPTIRQLVATLLRAEGHVVSMAVDGEDAIDGFDDTPPEVVVLDVMMPGIDGFGVLERLRDHEVWYDVPVIMLTARDDSEARKLGFTRGCDDYIAKPFDPDELLEAVARLAASARSVRVARRQARLEEFLASPIDLTD